YACRLGASASNAGETGGCPLGRSAYLVANSSWNGTSKLWWRCSRQKTHSLARRTRRTMVCSLGDRAMGGCQIAGRIGHSLDSPLLILPAYATIATLPRPLADYSTGALGLMRCLLGAYVARHCLPGNVPSSMNTIGNPRLGRPA